MRFQWLDALRGYAIIGVVLHHLGYLTPSGANGVQLFFIVSAITLIHSWRRHDDGTWQFYLRRICRIAPLYWLSIPAFLWLDFASGRDIPSYIQISATASFLHWTIPMWQNHLVPGSWSIACEMTFYTAFPFMVTKINSLRKALSVTAMSVLLAAFAWPLAMAYAGFAGKSDIHKQNEYAFYLITSQLPCFFLGFCIYYLGSIKVSRLVLDLVGYCGCAAFVALVYVNAKTSELYLLYAASMSMIAFALSHGRMRVLNNFTVAAIGKISYGIYLWHFFWLRAMSFIFPQSSPSWFAPDVVGVTLICSFATYCAIERPAMMLPGILRGSRPFKRSYDLDSGYSLARLQAEQDGDRKSL